MGSFLDSAEDIRQDKKDPPRKAHQAEEKLEKKQEQGVKMAYLEGRCDPEFRIEFPGLDLHVKSVDGEVVELNVRLHEWPTSFLSYHGGKSHFVEARPQPPLSLGRKDEALAWISSRFPDYVSRHPDYAKLVWLPSR